MVHDPPDLTWALDHREPRRTPRWHDAGDPRQGNLQRALVEKRDRGECEILCRGGHAFLDYQMREEHSDLVHSHVLRMAPVVESDIPHNPRDIRLLGATAVVQLAEPPPNDRQQAKSPLGEVI